MAADAVSAPREEPPPDQPVESATPTGAPDDKPRGARSAAEKPTAEKSPGATAAGAAESREKQHADRSQPEPSAPDDESPSAAENERLVVENLWIVDRFVNDHRSGGIFVSGGQVRAGRMSGRDSGSADGEPGAVVAVVSVSAVSADELMRLRAVTVSVECAAEATKIMNTHRFVILTGPPGAGKRTGGISLFAESKTVLEIDPSVSVRALLKFDERIKRTDSCHYVIESLTPDTVRGLNEFALRELTARLTKAKAYLVITVDHRLPLDRDARHRAVTWGSRPDPVEALRRHLAYYLPDTDPEQLLSKLPIDELHSQLADSDMRLTDRLAQRVCQALRDGTSLDDAVSDLGLTARRQVEQWFTRTPDREQAPRIPDISLLVACTVLGGCTYSTVAAHAARIESLLIDLTRAGPPDRSPTLARSQRLKAIMARLDSGLVYTEFGASLAETVALESGPLARAVLDVVWHEYDVIAEALLLWILDAGSDPDPSVRVRAAIAAGQLAAYDFAAIRRRVLLPWAKSGRRIERSAAAYALGVTALDATTAGQALGLLQHWATVDNKNLAATAAAACASYVGLAFPHIAMAGLLQIGLRDEEQWPLVIRCVLDLFGLGARQGRAIIPTVLGSLGDWLVRGFGPVAPLARQVFLDLLERATSPQARDSRDLWDAITDGPSRQHSAALLASCLNSDDSQKEALDIVRELLRAADADDALAGSLDGLMLDAVVTTPPNARAVRRITFYLEKWNTGPDASPSAARLLATISKEAAR